MNESSEVPETISLSPEKPIHEFDAVIVLSGAYRKGKRGFEFPTIVSDSPEKVFGGKMRLLAAVELLRREKTPLIILTGGKGLGENEISNAEAQSKYAQERLGVSRDNIRIAEETQYNTIGQAAFLKSYLEKEGIPPEKVVVITSAYHMPRAVRFFRQFGLNIRFLPAEKILWQKGPHYQKLIRDLYQSEDMDIRRSFEKAGIKALLEGNYQSPTDSKK